MGRRYNEDQELMDFPFFDIKAKSDLAKLFDFGDREAWIPNSLVDYEDSETVRIPIWLAKEKDLM